MNHPELMFVLVVIAFSIPAIQHTVERLCWKQERRAETFLNKVIVIPLLAVIVLLARILTVKWRW